MQLIEYMHLNAVERDAEQDDALQAFFDQWAEKFFELVYAPPTLTR